MAKISIIMATYNAGKYLEQALQSIISNCYEQKELIIIDGNSNDDSVEIIKKYSKNVNYWISEPDRGIYDAWNKGINKATGDWIMFLGADDILLHGSLNKYSNFLNSQIDKDELEYVSSRVQMINHYGDPLWVNGWYWEWPKFLAKMTVAHPGSLHSRKLFEKYGLYSTEYKITADYELLLRPKNKLKAAFMNEITVNMREGGASDSLAAIKEHYKAATTTGGALKSQAYLSGLYVYFKTKINKSARKVGFNLNVKR